MSSQSRPPPTPTDSRDRDLPEPSRRSILQGIGVAGATLAIPGPIRGVRALASTDDGAATPNFPSEVRLEPVVGGCRDVFAHSTTCGVSFLHEERVSDELGSHSFEVTFDGMPYSAFTGGMNAGAWATRYGLRVDREFLPSNAGPDYGPYPLVVYGNALEFGAIHDLTALDWHATCEVGPECRARWCEAFQQTVLDLRNSRADADRAIEQANLRLASQVFRVSVPSRRVEEVALGQLETDILTAVVLERARIQEEFLALREERLARERAEGREFVLTEGQLCGACRDCDPLFPPYGRVEAWDLRLTESSAATATWSRGDSSGQGWSHHGMTATVVLEKVDQVAEITGNTDGVVGGIVDVFVGIGVFLAGLLGFGPSRELLWEGKTVTASGWQGTGETLVTDRDTLQSWAHATGERTGQLEADEVELHVSLDDDDYSLTFPTMEASGVTTVQADGGGGSGDYEATVGFGEIIERRAKGHRDVLSIDTDGRNTDGEEGAARDPRWPLAVAEDACSLRLTEDLAVDLAGEGVDPNSGVSYTEPEGTANLRWELTPRRLSPDLPARRVGCP